MTRALLLRWAHREALKPGGSLIFSTGISPGGLGAGGWAMGASVESARWGGLPCFQVGGGCWAFASGARASTAASATASDVRPMLPMMSLPFDNLVANGSLVAQSRRGPDDAAPSGVLVRAEAAVVRVRGWTFGPAREGARRVDSLVEVRVRFTLSPK